MTPAGPTRCALPKRAPPPSSLQRSGDDRAERLKFDFKSATRPTHCIHTGNPDAAIANCADTAHELTNPEGDAHSPADFFRGIQLCVGDAVAAVKAEHRHTTRLAAALNEHRANHDPNDGADDDGGAASPTACDVTLQTQDGTGFPCHRLVLAAASGYFRTLFEGAFAESQAPVIQLKDCDAAMAGRVVVYVYTGKVEFDGVEDAAAVMEQAQFHQIDTLIQDCTDFLAPRVGASNSLLVGAVALGPLCTTLAEEARSITARDFDLASKTAMFLAGGVDTVKALLDDAGIHAGGDGRGGEDTVLQAVLAWVEHDAAARKQYLCALLDGVRLQQTSLECFAAAARAKCVLSDPAAMTKLTLGFSSRGTSAHTGAHTGGGGGGSRASKRARKT